MFVNAEPTPFPGMDRDYVAAMGRTALALKNRRDLLRVVDGSRRMLADRTPGRADLKIIEEETQ